MDGRGNWTGRSADHIEINLDAKVIADALLKDTAFINAVAGLVRVALTKQVRSMGNLFGQWAGK